MITAITLALVFGWWQATEKTSQPMVSATDPEYLSCTIWTGKNWTNPSARSARTPLMQSPQGTRAYGEVKVVVHDGSCQNTTTLYVTAGSEQKFKIAYSKMKGGNGIRLIGWSPNGDKLLAEVNLWEYETDRGYDHVAVVYDISTDTAKEVPALNQALFRHFGSQCEFEHAVEGWRNNEQVLVKVSQSPEDDSYEQHFCVKEPLVFVFDLQKNTLLADPRQRRKTN